MALLVMSQCRTAAARVTLLNKRSVLSVGTGENNLTLESQTKEKIPTCLLGAFAK